jgi:hypothetical protein
MNPIRTLLTALALTLSLTGAKAITFTTSFHIPAGNTTWDGDDIIVQGCTLTVDGPHSFRSLTLNGAVLNHSPAPNGETNNRIQITVTGDVLVDAVSRVDTSGRGYLAAGTPGAAPPTADDGGGGGHGGDGGWAYFGAAEPGGPGGFGSVTAPISFGGSAAGTADQGYVRCPGGGAVQFAVGGTLTLNGQVLANGASAWLNDQGGGAGGSVWITAGTLAGNGPISASGGNGESTHGGGGGGGRVALYYGTNAFSGSLAARGGSGTQWGGAGTMYVKATGEPAGTARLDNGGVWGALTSLTLPVTAGLSISNMAQVFATAPLSLTSLHVGANSTLFHFPTQSLSLTISGSAQIDLGGTVNGNGCGYPVGTNAGPGAAPFGSDDGGGGGYAGDGGWAFYGPSEPGGTGGYGSILTPTNFGSAGAGSTDNGLNRTAGGGAIRLIVAGTLLVNGQLSANGQAAYQNDQGGGAGGSLWLNVGELAGTGTISANGGNGEATHGGGGGGGRVAIYFASNNFAGTLTAYGNSGAQWGGAGSLYLKAASQPVGNLIVRNNTAGGALTPLTSPEAFRVLLDSGAQAWAPASFSVASLSVNEGGHLYAPPDSGTLTVTVQNDLFLAPGGEITASGRGYPVGADRGPSPGSVGGSCAGGGAYGGGGGVGGYGETGGAGGYGSLLQPTDYGSAGGNSIYGPGGAGGGAVRLTVGGTLTVNGTLTADGSGAVNNNAGGGAGGSLWLNVGTLAGTNLISANGGRGEAGTDGGGGGGGRIAIYYMQDNFTGALTAFGGVGAQWGGAGTLYRKPASQAVGDLMVRNNGVDGALTPLTSPETFRALLASGARVWAPASFSVASLSVNEGGHLYAPPDLGTLIVAVQNDLLIAGGGEITASGRGYPMGADRGPSPGSVGGSCAGGGAYGGSGGVGWYGEAGGTGGSGSLLQPTDYGSAGGNSIYGPGGAGGGAVRLTVGGTLTVNGTLTADGGGAVNNNTGGGAGGSLWLNVGTLAGTSVISASGGDGEDGDGGGGGGGRIAVYSTQDNFTGALTACGGLGRQAGGAGTIYRKLSAQVYGLLRCDNLGRAGALTPLLPPQVLGFVIADNAIVYPQLGQPLTFSSLDVGGAGQLTHLNGQRLTVNVLQDAVVQTNGVIAANSSGYPVGGNPGPGAGTFGGDTGSGAGYGGQGGHGWEGHAGGSPYGSAAAPVDWGSAGGPGDNGSRTAGGGVIQLDVAGTLMVHGLIAANGQGAFATDQGGASGGSVWLNAGALAGTGSIAANGGTGNYYGGGGGGGRVAIYHNGMSFDPAQITASGASGHEWGANGTVFFGNCLTNLPPAVLGMSPAGTVATWVESVEVTFNVAVDASTFTPADVVLTAPSGVVPTAQITVTELTPQTFRVSFPAQADDGVYTVQVGPAIANPFGTPMAAAYTGNFTINFPRTLSYTNGIGELTVSWPTATGLFYRLQTSPNLRTWVEAGGWIAGNGTPLQMTFPTTNAPVGFFRLQIGD